MADKNWKPILFTQERFFELLEMTREYYGAENDISQGDFLRHEYFENPAGDALIDLAVDRESDKLAGQYVVWPMRFLIGGRNVPCTCSLNTLTREDYCGQGIFTGLAERTYQRAALLGQQFCYGVPNQNSYPGFLKKLYFADLGSVPLYLRPLQPSAMVREFLHQDVLAAVAGATNPFFRAKGKKIPQGLRIVTLTVDTLPLMDRFWAAVAGKYPVMHIRDAVFAKFRYLNVPHRDYLPLLVLHAERPVGFAVGRIMEVAGMQCGMLADFLYAPGEERAAAILLSTILTELQKRGASVAGSLMLSHTQEALLLRKHAFFRCPRKMEPQPFPLILRLFRDELKTTGIMNLQSWFFTMGDYDVI